MSPWAEMIAAKLAALADAGHPNITVEELEEHVGLPVGIITAEIAVNLAGIARRGRAQGISIDADFRGDAAGGGPVIWLRQLIDVAGKVAA